MEEILSYELTSTSYFLVYETKEGHCFRKCGKSELSREVLLKTNSSSIEVGPQMTIDVTRFIDFMALVRKVPVKKMILKT